MPLKQDHTGRAMDDAPAAEQLGRSLWLNWMPTGTKMYDRVVLDFSPKLNAN